MGCELLEGGRSVKICSMSIYLLQVLQLSWSEETAGTRESGWAIAVVAAAWEAGFWGASADSLEPRTPVSVGELQGWTLSQAFSTHFFYSQTLYLRRTPSHSLYHRKLGIVDR